MGFTICTDGRTGPRALAVGTPCFAPGQASRGRRGPVACRLRCGRFGQNAVAGRRSAAAAGRSAQRWSLCSPPAPAPNVPDTSSASAMLRRLVRPAAAWDLYIQTLLICMHRISGAQGGSRQRLARPCRSSWKADARSFPTGLDRGRPHLPDPCGGRQRACDLPLPGLRVRRSGIPRRIARYEVQRVDSEASLMKVTLDLNDQRRHLGPRGAVRCD